MLDLRRSSRSSIKKNAILLPALALLISSIYSPISQARIVPPKLLNMIASSDCIVLGKVVAISRSRDAQIAEVEVERVLKGDRTIKRLYFWATPTWACDISYAEQNESGLYLLVRVKAFLANEMPKSPLYSITSSGYGRFVDKGRGRFEAPDLVRFPKNVAVRYVSKAQYVSAALVSRESILRLISTRNTRTATH